MVIFSYGRLLALLTAKARTIAHVSVLINSSMRLQSQGGLLALTTQVEVTCNGKNSSLLLQGINYDCKMFYCICPFSEQCMYAYMQCTFVHSFLQHFWCSDCLPNVNTPKDFCPYILIMPTREHLLSGKGQYS